MLRSKYPFSAAFEKHPQRTFLFAAFILLLALYGRSLNAPFVYDDLDQIVNNPNLQSWNGFAHRFLLQPVSLNSAYFGHASSTYRPLFWLSLYLDRNIWGLHPFAFHATSIIFHFLNGYLLFTFLRKWKFSKEKAAAAALLWLSLPINTEVVAWVSCLCYVLGTCFVLLCLLSMLTYQRTRKPRWAALCFLTALAALCTYEQAVVTLPLAILLVFSRPWKTIRAWVPVGAIALATIGVEVLRTAVGVHSFSSLASLPWIGLALWQHVILALLPIHMSVERSTSISLQQPHFWPYVGLGCLALALLFFLIRRKWNTPPLVGVLWFLIAVAPLCLIRTYQGIAERTIYLADIGIVISIVAAMALLKGPHVRRVFQTCLLVWVAWNLGRTFLRVGDWTDPLQLYRSSLAATPQSALLHYNIAFTLRENGQLLEAIQEYRQALAMHPQYPHAYASIGDTYLQMNSYTEAETAYLQALEQNPKDTLALLNLGTAYQSSGDSNKAEAAFQKIIQIDPHNASAYTDLGVLYMGEKRSTEAIYQFAKAIDLRTTDIVPYYDLGVLFQQSGRGDLAMVLYKKVLELKPDDQDTIRNIQILRQ